MTIAVDWDVKHQTKQTNIYLYFSNFLSNLDSLYNRLHGLIRTCILDLHDFNVAAVPVRPNGTLWNLQLNFVTSSKNQIRFDDVKKFIDTFFSHYSEL